MIPAIMAGGRTAAGALEAILWILQRAGRRSGLFPNLPPPLPEQLSSLLTYGGAVVIDGRDWYAVRFAQPVPTVLDPDETAVVVVARQTAPARTWAFRSPDDRAPRTAERYVTRYDLTPTERFVTQGIEPLHVGFELSVFDDLEVLKD